MSRDIWKRPPGAPSAAPDAAGSGFLDGWPLLPVLVLFFINWFDEFDTFTFAVLTPEIKDEFGLSTAAVAAIGSSQFLLSSILVLFIGWLADRFVRTRLVLYSAVVASMASLLTGLAGGVLVLVLLRIGNGIGRLVNDPVHTSLLTDYYPLEQRPKAFALHRAANPMGAILGPIMGGAIGAWFGWRWAFVATALPLFVAALFVLRLREPIRGETDDLKAADETKHEEPMPFGRAWRYLYGVRTLRRIWFAAFFAGAGVGPISALFSLYWRDVYGVGSFGRGLISGVSAAFAAVALIWAGGFTSGLVRRGTHTIPIFTGIVFALSAVMLLLSALAPSLILATIPYVAYWTCVGFFFPPFVTISAIVVPARVRSQGLSYNPLFLSLGAIVTAPLAGIADVHGYRWAIAAFTPLVFFAGIMLITAYRFVRGDADRARKVLETEVRLREERLSLDEQTLLVCRDLNVSIDLLPILHDVNIEVKEHEIVALLGTNGAGKSTLLRTVAGALHPDSGVIFFDGTDTTFYEPEETAAAGIVLAPGGRGIFPDLTVADSLLAAGWPLRLTPKQVAERIEEVIDVFPRLGERLSQRAGTLSGGEQQMLSLGLALMTRPKLLMIDELTLGLAPVVVETLVDAVRRIHATGITIVLVEQSVNEALKLADRAYFMERGRIMFEGPTKELLRREDLLRAVFLKSEVAV